MMTPNTKTTHLDTELHRHLRRMAVETDLSLAELVETAIARLLFAYDSTLVGSEGHLTPAQLRHRRDHARAVR